MHGNAGIAKHGLRPGRGDHDIIAGLGASRIAVLIEDRVLIGDAVSERIAKVPEGALDFFLLDFEVRDGGLKVWVPVHEPLVAVDEALIVEVYENLADRFLHLVVRIGAVAHGEALILPVAGRAEAFQLLDDLAAGFLSPFPNTVDEGFAAEAGAALIAVCGELALNHHLGRDTGMVRARLPADILAAHALKPDEDILQRIVERVAHMKDAGDVWRRDDDRIGLRTRIAGRAEAARLLPALIDAPFGALRIEALVKHVVGPSSGQFTKEKARRFRARLVSISG